MGNKQEKENSKVDFEECKKEYFKAIHKDLKDTMKKINNKIHTDGNSNEKENWVDYLKLKFNEYVQKNKITNKNFQRIFFFLNGIEETNESKHIYNLSIFLKKYFDDSMKSKQKNLIDTYYAHTEIDNDKANEDITNLSKDVLLWRGSEFIFEDLEKLDHPLTAFIRYLGFILAEIYEKEFDKAQSCVMDEENFQNSMIMNENRNSRESITNIKSDYTHEETSEDDSVFSIKKYQCEKNYKSAFFAPSNFYIHNKGLDEFFKRMQKEILYISNILTGALIRFYNIKNSCSEKILEIFLEKIKDIFLRNDLYRIIYEIKSSLLSRKKNEFSANLIKLYNLKPYYFGTYPYFSQDREFKKVVKKICKDILPENFNRSLTKSFKNRRDFNKDDLNLRKCSFSNVMKINMKINFLSDHNEMEGIKLNNHDREISKNILKIPFDESLLLLRKLNDCSSILKRIDLMFMLRASILSEIDRFWFNIPLKMKYRSVDADNLLSIFIYLIIKSQMSNLLIDVEIIDCFISKNIKLSRKGYFFSLFQSSIEYIIDNVNMEQIDTNIKEYNINIMNEIKKIKFKPSDVLDIIDEDRDVKLERKITHDNVMQKNFNLFNIERDNYKNYFSENKVIEIVKTENSVD